MGLETDNLILIGTNHRKSPLEFREKVAFNADEVPQFLELAHSRLDGSDCFLISTCNRTEFYSICDNGASSIIWELLDECKAVNQERDAGKFYIYRGEEVVRQLFRVATGIDSMMLGEPQVLQQVKAAYEIGLKTKVAGVVGERLLSAAIRCGKRARAETDISRGAISVAYAAVSLSHKVFADLTPRVALVVGAGETGELVARNLREHAVGQLLIANRTLDHARDLATQHRGEPMALEQLDNALAKADIVITTAATPEQLITREMVVSAMKKRPRRTMLIVDIGVPRNVDPDVRRMDNIFLYDMDGLKGMIDQNILRRQREVPKVEAIIEEEVTRFLEWYSGLSAGPVIKQLREHLENLREMEIKRLKGATPEQVEAMQKVTHGLLNKILHAPTTALREAIGQGEAGKLKVQFIRDIFGLDPDSPSITKRKR